MNDGFGEPLYVYGLRGWPSVCVSNCVSFFPLVGLEAFAGECSRALLGEVEKGGILGLLRFAAVLCAGSDGPGRGVVSESSLWSSSEAGTDCSDAVEFDTGEQGNGAIVP